MRKQQILSCQLIFKAGEKMDSRPLQRIISSIDKTYESNNEVYRCYNYRSGIACNLLVQ